MTDITIMGTGNMARGLATRATGRLYVDITKPVDTSTFEGLAVPVGSSAAEELQKATDAKVVKAFNTTFAATLAEGAVAGQPWMS